MFVWAQIKYWKSKRKDTQVQMSDMLSCALFSVAVVFVRRAPVSPSECHKLSWRSSNDTNIHTHALPQPARSKVSKTLTQSDYICFSVVYAIGINFDISTSCRSALQRSTCAHVTTLCAGIWIELLPALLCVSGHRVKAIYLLVIVSYVYIQWSTELKTSVDTCSGHSGLRRRTQITLNSSAM